MQGKFLSMKQEWTFRQRRKLLQDVSVSDGLNVVSTDSDGTFRLPGHTRAHFLFITTPSGYKTDNAYYRPIETGRMEYDFLYILVGMVFWQMEPIGLYIFQIRRFVERR